MSILQYVRGWIMTVIFHRPYDKNTLAVDTWTRDNEDIDHLVEHGNKKNGIKRVG